MADRGAIDDSSARLVRRLRARDPAVIEDLYSLYGRLLYVLIVRIVGDAGVAEDLVHETFLRAWNRSNEMNDQYASVGPWLVMISRYCALDYRKSQHGTLISRVMTTGVLPLVTVDVGIISPEHVGALQKAFQNLTEVERKVVQLAYYGGLSQQEIASEMRCPLGMVKEWLRSAFSGLRDKLATHAATQADISAVEA